MPKTGRPRALDEHKLTAICAVVSHGGSLEEAAQLIDCAPSTIYREKRRNEQFRKQLHEAQVKATLTPYHRMNTASRRSWRAAAWMLEHNRPQRDLEYSAPSPSPCPEDGPPGCEPRQSVFDRPISPATAALGAYVCDRLVQVIKERQRIDRSDQQTPAETSTSDTAEPFATAE